MVIAMENRSHFTVDAMTRLPNFFAFLPQLEDALKRGKGALLCLDVKDLSTLNTLFGRAAGDLVIESVVKVLHGPVVKEFLSRRSRGPAYRHWVFRTGGDEFVALFPGVSEEEAHQLGRRLDEAFRLQAKQGGIDVPGLHVAAIGYPIGRGTLAEILVAITGTLIDCQPCLPAMPSWGLQVFDKMIQRIKETLSLLDKAFDAAHTDAITGLPNHRAGEQVLRSTLAGSEVGRDDCSLLFVDGDNLKSYNEHLGYEGGNEMIRRLGQVIQNSVRKGDFVCRWLSGDEFLVILPRTRRDDATVIAERIRKRVWEESSCWPRRVTVSVGIATTETEGWDADRLLKRAIQANFQAKQEGKNLVV